MTERLYYADSYLREFRARIVDRAGDLVYLDRTAFYPTSGGQPSDAGEIGGARVVDVIDEGERIAHRVSGPVDSAEAACCVDWARRFDHMQQHSGQHLLSAVLARDFAAPTVSFHLGEAASTIDVEAGALDAPAVEAAVNLAVVENLPIAVSFEDAASVTGLRKASDREGTLRIVSIEGRDRSACGGTHVRATGEIGPVLIRKLEKVRATLRIEFLCGLRAVRRARADFDALSRVARMSSSSLDEVPDVVAAQMEAARAGERIRKKQASDLAAYRGRELYDAAVPDTGGVRRLTQEFPSGSLEDLRAVAQSFTSRPRAVYLAVLRDPPSVLLAASEDAGVDAGKLVKSALAGAGGRGGGTARMAQGGVSAVETLAAVAGEIARALSL